MFRIAICDHSVKDIRNLRALLMHYQAGRRGVSIEVRYFCSPVTMLGAVKFGKAYDLYLIDPLMSEMGGVELARKLRENGEDAPVVFVTTLEDRILDAFGLSAGDYIRKPIKKEKLFSFMDEFFSSHPRMNNLASCSNKVVENTKSQNRGVLISTKDGGINVPLDLIVRITTESHRLCFQLTDGRTILSRCVRIPFVKAIAPLLSDERFLLVRASCIINMAEVESTCASAFVLKGGEKIRVPKYNYAGTKRKYLEYLSLHGTSQLGGSITRRSMNIET